MLSKTYEKLKLLCFLNHRLVFKESFYHCNSTTYHFTQKTQYNILLRSTLSSMMLFLFYIFLVIYS